MVYDVCLLTMNLPLLSTLQDLSYKERVKELDLPTLKYRTFIGDLILVYKMINQIDDLKFDHFFYSDQIRHNKYR